MRELEFIKYCEKCGAIYDYEEVKGQCNCGEAVFNGYKNEIGELERKKTVSADVIYKDENGQEVKWHHISNFGENVVDMFYGWLGYWEDFFEQEAEMRKDNFKEYLRIENLNIINPNE